MDYVTFIFIVIVVSAILLSRGRAPGRYERLDGPVDDDWQRAQREHLDHFRPRREV